MSVTHQDFFAITSVHCTLVSLASLDLNTELFLLKSDLIWKKTVTSKTKHGVCTGNLISTLFQLIFAEQKKLFLYFLKLLPSHELTADLDL